MKREIQIVQLQEKNKNERNKISIFGFLDALELGVDFKL